MWILRYWTNKIIDLYICIYMRPWYWETPYYWIGLRSNPLFHKKWNRYSNFLPNMSSFMSIILWLLFAIRKLQIFTFREQQCLKAIKTCRPKECLSIYDNNLITHLVKNVEKVGDLKYSSNRGFQKSGISRLFKYFSYNWSGVEKYLGNINQG